MNVAEARALLPRDENDVDSAALLAALAPDDLALVVDEAFAWMRDGNWPVAKVIAPALVKLGALGVATLEKILRGDDDIWKYWALHRVVKELAPDVRKPLDALLESIARAPTIGERAEELPDIAAAILARR